MILAIIRIADPAAFVFVETRPAVFLPFGHASLTGPLALAFTTAGVNEDNRLIGPLFRTQHRFVGAIFILRAEQKPLVPTEVIFGIRVKCCRNDDKSVPSAVANIQYLAHIVIAHEEASPVENKAPLPAVRKLEQRLTCVLVGIAE